MRSILTSLILFSGLTMFAQTPTPTPTPAPQPAADSSTSTDLFIMVGSDFDRPGLLPRANYNIGIGHTFDILTKSTFGKIFGDEVTASYTYENAGSHGWFHSSASTSTESFGLMKNFGIPYFKDWENGTIAYTKKVTLYTWPQIGVTQFVPGGGSTTNHVYGGVALGAIYHISNHCSIWLQEGYNKVESFPWYTTTSIGPTFSW